MSKTKISALLFSVVFIALCTGFSIGVYNESKTVNFGGTSDPVPRKRIKYDCCRTINRDGLTELKAYGSGIIYFPDFKEKFKDKSKDLFIVNLLNEDIYYYKDKCLRWYGLGYMEKDFGTLIFSHKPFKLAYKALIRFIYGTPPIHDLSQIKTEQQIVEEFGGKYYLAQKESSDWFNDKNFIGNMIHFFESLPPNSSLYIHCAHGKGRTTTYLVLYDIFRNAKNVSLKDIANRHYCLGREDVLNTELWAEGSWTQKALNARKDLVEKFYAYMTDPNGYGTQSWDHWMSSNMLQIEPITVHRSNLK